MSEIINGKKNNDDLLVSSIKNIKSSSVTNNHSVIKKLILKVKDELAKEEIKNEINNIVHPIYEDIYYKIFPHYITLMTLLIVIIILLLVIILINIFQSKNIEKNDY
jgi:hypothetical protein